LVFEDITSGAQNDLQDVTRLARAMVTQLGMAEEIGPEYLGGAESALDGRTYAPWEPKDYSEETAARIDMAVHRLIEEAHQCARSILSEHQDTLHAVATALLLEESLDRDQLLKLVNAVPAPAPRLKPVAALTA
jgi:cell division protease FtsH